MLVPYVCRWKVGVFVVSRDESMLEVEHRARLVLLAEKRLESAQARRDVAIREASVFWSLGEIAECAGMSKTNVHRIVHNDAQ